MSKEIEKINTVYAPDAIGPYSQGIIAGNYIYLSGQIPIDSKTGQIISGSIKEQTLQVLENLQAILKSRDLDFTSVIKTEVFLVNMDDFKKMNEVYACKFSHDIKPARQVVGVV